MGVAELHPFDNLPHDLLHESLLGTHRIFLEVVQSSMIHKLKHKVQTLLPPKHLDQVDQVLVAELLQQCKDNWWSWFKDMRI